MKKTSAKTWALLASCTGIGGVLAYFGAAFLPLPDLVAYALAFAFGPLLAVSFLATYRYMANHYDGPVLQFAAFFGVVAGVMVTAMLVVQVGNNMVLQEGLAEADSGAARESVRLAWRAVNRVQYLLDVVWDIFICLGTLLLGVAMLGHPDFGKIWGSVGIVAAAALLFLNLYTFPYAPAEAGSVDLGPALALWCLAVFIRLGFLSRRAPNAAT